MTTGSQNNNQIRSIVGPYSGYTRAVGTRFSKAWSGDDYYAPGRPLDVIAWYPPQPVFKKGRLVAYKRPRPVLARPPKRKRTTEEHAYSVDFLTETHGLVIEKQIGYPVTDNSTSAYLGVGAIDWGWTSNDDLLLAGKLREAVVGSDFNAGVFLAEGRTACEMIANSARRIARSLLYLKKGRFPQAIRSLTDHWPRAQSKELLALSRRKTLANNWLELQYGWMPLLQDAKSGAEFLAHHFSVPLQMTLRVSRRSRGGSFITTSPTNANYADSVCFRRTSIKAVLKERDVIQLSGLVDPLSVAWELVPYSFVIDWFIPIGNYLAARGLAQGLTGTFTTSTLWRVRGRGLARTNPAWQVMSVSPPPSVDYGSFRRSISTSLPIPVPSVKPLSKVLSWTHAANAVALLQGIRSRL